MKKNKKTYIIFSILILIFSIAIVEKSFQNDTFFTIAIGRNILENGLSFTDTLTWHENLEFLHSGEFDVIIATIFNKFSYLGIYIFVILMTTLIGLTLFNILLKKENNIILSFIYVVIAMYFSKSNFTARAQIISYLIFIIEIYLIEELQEKQKIKYSILLIVNAIILANFHASVWPMYLVFFMPYIVEEIIAKLNVKILPDKLIANTRNLKQLLITFGICAIAGLCSPTFTEPYTDLIKVMSGISTSLISELQGIKILSDYQIVIYTGITIVLVHMKKNKFRISDCILILGLYTIAFLANRNRIFLFLMSPIIIARWLTEILNIANDSVVINELTDTFNKNNKILIIFIIVFMILCAYWYIKKDNTEYVNNKYYPVEATEYIINNIDTSKIKLYNEFNYGSYLEFKGIKTFIDSRSGMFTEQFNKDVTILEDYYNIHCGIINYNELFTKYGITHGLISKSSIVYTYIKSDDNYSTLYEDDNFAIIEKKS